MLVDGEPTEFEYYPHNHQNVENEKRWRSMVSLPSSAADAAAAVYISALERELVPNLLINCCKPFKGLTDQIEQLNLENKLDSSAEPKQVTVAKLSTVMLFMNYLFCWPALNLCFVDCANSP